MGRCAIASSFRPLFKGVFGTGRNLPIEDLTDCDHPRRSHSVAEPQETPMTDTPRFVPFDLTDVEPEDGAPPADRVVRGDPRTRTWVLDETDGGSTVSGIWEATPGTWRIAYDEWEFCTIVSGISILHEDGAPAPHVLREGDSFVIRPGFAGLWEVVETTRKVFVIRLP
jgi:uncharacterized cupin superfamily protein